LIRNNPIKHIEGFVWYVKIDILVQHYYGPKVILVLYQFQYHFQYQGYTSFKVHVGQKSILSPILRPHSNKKFLKILNHDQTMILKRNAQY